jgi:hypothetical protein
MDMGLLHALISLTFSIVFSPSSRCICFSFLKIACRTPLTRVDGTTLPCCAFSIYSMIEPPSHGHLRIVTHVAFWCPCCSIPMGIWSPFTLHIRGEPHAVLLIMLIATPYRVPHLWFIVFSFIISPLLHPYSDNPSFLCLHSPTLEEISIHVPIIDYLHL